MYLLSIYTDTCNGGVNAYSGVYKTKEQAIDEAVSYVQEEYPEQLNDIVNDLYADNDELRAWGIEDEDEVNIHITPLTIGTLYTVK